MADEDYNPALDGTTCWLCEECGEVTNGETSMPCRCMARRLQAERKEKKANDLADSHQKENPGFWRPLDSRYTPPDSGGPYHGKKKE